MKVHKKTFYDPRNGVKVKVEVPDNVTRPPLHLLGVNRIKAMAQMSMQAIDFYMKLVVDTTGEDVTKKKSAIVTTRKPDGKEKTTETTEARGRGSEEEDTKKTPPSSQGQPGE